MSIRTNTKRIGNITSSQVHRLMGTPAKRKTYIEELRMERKLGRSLDTETFAKPMLWGKLLEDIVFNKLGLAYEITSTDTISHPNIEGWAGSPDGVKQDCVMDIKCPYTLKSFCELSEICLKQDIENFKSEKPEYYWQLVSNSILTGLKNAELIVYCPMESDLGMIRHKAQNVKTEDLFKYYWLGSALDDELPYITESSEYKSLIQFEFEVPESDKQLLTETIKKTLSEL